MKQLEYNDIVCELNHEHLKLLINEDIKDEYDGLKQHSRELYQLMILNISF